MIDSQYNMGMKTDIHYNMGMKMHSLHITKSIFLM